jgi:hypothetical protein
VFEREAINSSSRGTQDSIRMSLRRPNNNRGWRYMCKSSRGSSLLVGEELAGIAWVAVGEDIGPEEDRSPEERILEGEGNLRSLGWGRKEQTLCRYGRVGVLELLKDTRPAKLSFAGVAGFEGAFKGLAEPAPAPDGCADRAARGVERPESCGAGLWRKGGNAAGVLADGLVGCDQSRPLRSSMVAVGVWYALGILSVSGVLFL